MKLLEKLKDIFGLKHYKEEEIEKIWSTLRIIDADLTNLRISQNNLAKLFHKQVVECATHQKKVPVIKVKSTPKIKKPVA